MNKDNWIERYELQPHPEGGYYREIHRSSELVNLDRGERSAITSIVYLLGKNDCSHWHRILSDESWSHLHGNADLCIHIIDEQGQYSSHLLGKNHQSALPVYTVPAKHWFAVETVLHQSQKNNQEFALTSCTVAPGFHWEDFTLAKRDELTLLFPQHEAIISKFTSDG